MKFAQSCPTLCNPVDYGVHGILQARILEWVAFPFSRGSSHPRDRTQVSRIAGRFFTSLATREAIAYIVIQDLKFSHALYKSPPCFGCSVNDPMGDVVKNVGIIAIMKMCALKLEIQTSFSFV